MRRSNFLLLSVLVLALSLSTLAQEDRCGIVVMSIQRDSMMVKALIDAANEKLWFQDARYAIDYAEGDFKEEGFKAKWVIVGSVDGTVSIKYKVTDKKGRVKEEVQNDTYISLFLFDYSSNEYLSGKVDLEYGTGLSVFKGKYKGPAKSFMKKIKQYCYCEYSIGAITGRDKKGRPQYIIANAGSAEGLEVKKKLWLYYDSIDDYGNLNREMLAKMVVTSIEGPHSCQAEIVSNYDDVALYEEELGNNPMILSRTTGEPKKATGFIKVGLKPFTKKSSPSWLPRLAHSHVLMHLIEDGKVRVPFDGKGFTFNVSFEFTNAYCKPVQLEMIDPINKTKKTVTGKKCFLEYERKIFRPGSDKPAQSVKYTCEGESGFDANYLIHETMKNWAKDQASSIANYAIAHYPIKAKCLEISKTKCLS